MRTAHLPTINVFVAVTRCQQQGMSTHPSGYSPRHTQRLSTHPRVLNPWVLILPEQTHPEKDLGPGIPTPPDGQTHASEKITFLQLRWRVVKSAEEYIVFV